MNKSVKIRANKKKTHKVKRLKRSDCIWSGKLKKKGRSGLPLGSTKYKYRDFYIFPFEIHNYLNNKFIGKINLKADNNYTLIEDNTVKLVDANGSTFCLRDASGEEQGNLKILMKILDLMGEGKFVLKLKTIDTFENEIKSEPEYVFIPNSKTHIVYNLKGLQFEDSFYDYNEQFQIIDKDLNLDDDTIEILGTNEKQGPEIFVFKNDINLLSDFKKIIKLVRKEEKLQRIQEQEELQRIREQEELQRIQEQEELQGDEGENQNSNKK